MSNVEKVFRLGYVSIGAELREELPFRHIAVDAAWQVFAKWAAEQAPDGTATIRNHPDFKAQGPVVAKLFILDAAKLHAIAG